MAIYPLFWMLRLQSKFSRNMYMAKPQIVTLKQLDVATENMPILDIGGGGAGIIGRLYGNRVVAVDLRQDELDQAPDGPVKIAADAKDLPFTEAHFNTATAFYFFMYLKPQDYPAVLTEAYRVLKPGGVFHIWDTSIPNQTPALIKHKLFAVPVAAVLPKRTVQTAYGVQWQGREQNAEILTDTAKSVGFTIHQIENRQNGFYIVLKKS